MKQIIVEKNIPVNNNELADKNRKLLDEKQIFTINLLGSPGSGKTCLLEKLIENIKTNYNMAVIQGDLYTAKDAMRIEKHNIDVIQLNTGGLCYLDAGMISTSLDNLDINKLDFLAIENIGNLAFPEEYDLSEDMKIVVMSTTEGNDKPFKYPLMFKSASVVILNKLDIIDHTNFDINEFKESEFFRILEKNKEIVVESNLYPNLEIKFMSVHKSKGIEADEVIIINNKNNIVGFPNKMVSDSVLSYVITDEELFTFAEERRLFYVALTRTKNHCYLMCPDENSNFTEELKSYENVEYIICDDKEEKIPCPICKTGHLVKRQGKNNKEFYSCNNFPQCRFKTSDMTNVRSKVRCPSCGNFMSKRKGPYGEFYGCNSYPNCKTTYTIEEFEKLDKDE